MAEVLADKDAGGSSILPSGVENVDAETECYKIFAMCINIVSDESHQTNIYTKNHYKTFHNNKENKIQENYRLKFIASKY